MKGISCLVCILYTIASIHGLKTRIYRGSDAPEGKYPYHAFLYSTVGDETICGGSIIDKRWILTAAHCFKDELMKDVRIQVGSISDKNGIIYHVEQRIAHESFNRNSLVNDIALLRVDRDIEFNDKVQPIPLANRDAIVDDNENVVLTGFGRTEQKNCWGLNICPEILQTISLKVFDFRRCKAIDRRISETQICTITTKGKGPCKGDSGGPLVNDYGIQVGIDSHSYGPCGEVPEIYTSVSSFRSWIDEKIRQH